MLLLLSHSCLFAVLYPVSIIIIASAFAQQHFISEQTYSIAYRGGGIRCLRRARKNGNKTGVASSIVKSVVA